MYTLEFFMGLALGAGSLAVLVVGFFIWAIYIYEKMERKHHNSYANRIEAAVKNLERIAAEGKLERIATEGKQYGRET